MMRRAVLEAWVTLEAANLHTDSIEHCVQSCLARLRVQGRSSLLGLSLSCSSYRM